MNAKLKELLQRVETWPETDQAEVAELLEQIEIRHRDEYHASVEELAAIDEADRSGVADPKEVEAAFKAFRRA